MREIKTQKTLVEQTYDILVDAICSGELPPGERLTQEDVAARLNVSRQPVNNAFAMLRANRFVEDTGRRGVVVSEISVEQFRSIYEFRTAIEPFAIRLAARRLPANADREAKDMMERGRATIRSGTAKDQVEADMAFHEMIYRWTGNATIAISMRMNWQHMRRAMSAVLREGVAAATSWEEHAQIVEALLDGDADRSATVMLDHIERAQEKTLGALEDLLGTAPPAE
jgi:DNA-binding GntR family transcriptional regulator